MAKRGIPALMIDVDLRESAQASAFIKHFLLQMSTQAHIYTVLEASHNIFADKFDEHMAGVAKTNPDNYFHVYEYDSSGTSGFERVGERGSELWRHTRQGQGNDLTFSWNWLPASEPNPTYEQRRASRVGYDGIRSLSEEDFDELLEKSSGREYKFVWKAPMLEYGLQRIVYPRRKRLMLPRRGKKVFVTNLTATSQHPGDTAGNFTKQWAYFWNVEVPQQWNDVLGNEIERDAAMRIEAGLAKGRRPRAERRTFQFKVVSDVNEAEEIGKAMAISAIRTHQRSYSGIQKNIGRFTQ